MYSRKHLEMALSNVAPFRVAKTSLEQYPTSAHLASCVLSAIEEDIVGRRVADLGCGTGMLGIGAALMGAASVVGYDIDPDAIAVAQDNVSSVCGYTGDELGTLDFVLCDVYHLPTVSYDTSGASSFPYDVVISNPPFGTRGTRGADMMFVQSGLGVAPVVYSLHKTSSRRGVLKKAEKKLGATATVLAELRFDLPKTMKFHKKKSVDIEVDLIKFERLA